MTEPQHGDRPHSPGPSLYPIGFAAGIACILVGLIINPMVIVPIGAVIAVVCGFLWARDATKEFRGEPVAAIEPERGGPRESTAASRDPRRSGRSGHARAGDGRALPAQPVPRGRDARAGRRDRRSRDRACDRLHDRSRVRGQGYPKVDLGPLENFTEGKWFVTKFFMNPEAGEVSHRTAYIRNNGLLNGEPSFTIISNRCAHLGCPVQPNGPVQDNQTKEIDLPKQQRITMIPAIPAGGYGCPCHGGQYDAEGNRVSGPPVRALDRYEFEVVDGHLILGKPYSVSHVKGEGRTP